jgi:tRNA wybutosine-synthesizing protein 3
MYTTSSCAGRVVLLVEPESGRKKDTEWLYVTHGTASLNDVVKSLEKPPIETVWLRMEPFIVHLAVQDIDKANDLMETLISVGLKHSGILTTKRRVMVEIVGNERMEAPVSIKGKLIVTKEYLSLLVELANRKLNRNRERLALLYGKLSMK